MWSISPILIPSPTNSSILLIDYKFNVFQSFWYANATVDARVASTNHDNLQWSQVLDGHIVELEGLVCGSAVCDAICMDPRRIRRQIRNGRHDDGSRIGAGRRGRQIVFGFGHST